MSTANPSLGVNRVISDVLITARAHEAAAALPPGSARVTVLEFGESALKLLGLLLQRADRGDEDADTLDRCVAEGHLSVGLLREILEGAHHVLGDRERIERLVGNQNLVGGIGADERFEVGQSGDQDIVGDPLTASHACCGLDGDRQVRRYNEVPFRDISTHNKSPYVARALTRYVTGAVLMPFRWLQRKAVTRRAASTARPSGTIPGGER